MTMFIEHKVLHLEVDPKTKFYVLCVKEERIMYQALEDNPTTRIIANEQVLEHGRFHPTTIIECRPVKI